MSAAVQDLTGAIIRIDAAARGVDGVFATCVQLDAGTKQAWSAWYTGWQQWVELNKNLSAAAPGLEGISRQIASYESDVAGWQEDADAVCSAQIPVLVTQAPSKTHGRWEPILGTVRWVAGAVIISMLVPPITEAVRSFHEARRTRRS
jgi:hypothetical protein